MNFFPTIYEDEILYSVIARYHRRSANTTLIYSLDDLFSNKYIKVNIDLPGYINKLIDNFPKYCNYTGKDIILRTTMYPFFAFFSSPSFSEELFNLMLENDNNSIQAKAGIKRMNINTPTYFRFCEECMSEDMENYGEFYWHRIHQIPGVHICPKHRKVLYDSKVKLKNYNIREFISPSEENCVKNEVVNYSKDIEDKLYQLSKDIEFIFNTDIEKKDENWYWKNYQNALIKMGLATINGNLIVREVVCRFKSFYGEEFLNLLQCNINDEGYNNWLLDIFRKPRKRHHPIKHILIIRFLGYSIKEMVETKIRYKPFGSGPWPCMNKVCANYKKNSIENVKTTYYKGEDKIVGEFECSCGFKYTRKGPDENCNFIYEITKIKEYGYIWDKRLEELVYNGSYTLKEMEEILGTDKGTIYRHAKKLKLPIYKKIEDKDDNEIKYIDKDIIKIDYYEKWLSLVLGNPDKSKTELRNIDLATYAWLYKNNKEWLDKNSPVIKKETNSYSVVDWKKRDEEVLRLIKNSIEYEFNPYEKPSRITISYISRIINRPLNYYLSTGKVPKVKKYVDSIVENIDEYRKRKIEWSIRSLIYKDEEPTVYKVQSLLNFQPQVKKDYESYIMNLICNSDINNI